MAIPPETFILFFGVQVSCLRGTHKCDWRWIAGLHNCAG